MQNKIVWETRPDGVTEARIEGWRLSAYWDDQDPHNEGWAWRVRRPDGSEESGPADSLEQAQAEAEELLPPE